MIIRDKLVTDMTKLVNQSKWDQILQDLIYEIIETKPENPYVYIQKKLYILSKMRSLRQKFDNTKTSSYICEMAMYLTTISPLTTSEQSIKNKITSIVVDKYQHTKIKKSQVHQFITSLLYNLRVRQKQQYLKLIQQILDKDHYTIIEYSELLYQTIVFRQIVKEISDLENKVTGCGLSFSSDIMKQYVLTINEDISIIKCQRIQIQTSGDLYKMMAVEIVQKIQM